MTPEQLAKPGTEHSHQVALFCWANEQSRLWGNWNDNASKLKLMFAIPNGGLRHKAEANKLKSEGVKAGVPDIFLPVAIKSRIDGSVMHYGLFIEMKKPTAKPKREGSCGGVSVNQNTWHIALWKQGYKIAVCYSWQEARDVILAYLGVT